MTEDSENKTELKEIPVDEILDKIQKDVDRTEALKKIPRTSSQSRKS
jgi:hypothetical protein